jgi:hypothetical protein
MLLKAIGQPIDTAERVKECRWEMPKATGKLWVILKGIGKLLGKAIITPINQ